MKLRNIRKSPLVTGLLHRSFFFANLGLIIFIFFYTFFFIRPQDSAIPLQYSTLQGFELGQWYHATSFVIFALICSITNFSLAHMLASRSDDTDQFEYPWTSRLLMFNLFLLCLVIAVLRSIVRTL